MARRSDTRRNISEKMKQNLTIFRCLIILHVAQGDHRESQDILFEEELQPSSRYLNVYESVFYNFINIFKRKYMRMMSNISQYKTEAQNFVKTFTRETALALAKKRTLIDFSKISREDLNLSKIWSGSSKSLPNLTKLANVSVPSQPFLGQRSMSYPSTFVAKVAKFPISYYKRANWMWKYWMIACVCCLPLFANFNTEKNPANSEHTPSDLQATPTNYAEK